MQLETDAIDRVLSGMPLFSGLAPECLTSLATHCRMQTFERGESVFRKGDSADGFYYVFDGKVKLFFVSERGNEKIVEVLKPGMTFGEAVVFIDEPYPVYAQAMADSHLLFIQREGMLQAIEEHPQMTMRLLAGLSRRMHVLISGLEALCVMTSRERVVGFLLTLLDQEGRDAMRIELPATKAVVASMLNLTPETFSRILHALEKDGILRIGGRTIEILDGSRLRESATC